MMNSPDTCSRCLCMYGVSQEKYPEYKSSGFCVSGIDEFDPAVSILMSPVIMTLLTNDVGWSVGCTHVRYDGTSRD